MNSAAVSRRRPTAASKAARAKPGAGKASSRRSDTASRLALLCQLIDAVLALTQPADAVISSFFRAHPEVGARDRGFLAECAWSVLRHRTWYTHLATRGEGNMHRRLALLAAESCFGRESIAREITEQEREWLDHAALLAQTQVDPLVRASLPSWIADELALSLDAQDVLACAHALNESASLDLRVNTLLCTPDQALAALRDDGIDAEAYSFMPDALRVHGKPALQRSAAFAKGWVEVQDVGSQLVAKLVAPKRGAFVVDFCAGAGGKTLALGSALKNTGRLYALDVSAARLAKLKPRLARSGLSNVWPSAIASLVDDRVKRLAGKADAVLVDAPCSGIGTLRRNPDLKWRMNAERVTSLTGQQSEILAAASRLVKPGGVLVYATCSLLGRENTGVVDAFLAQHPAFHRVSCQEVLAASRINLPEPWRAFQASGDVMLWPHQTGTDGFFVSVMRRD